MTREEARNILKHGLVNAPSEEAWCEAFHMAIKALEQEPTTKNDLEVDAVSRKEVFNQIFFSTDNNGDVVLGSALRERIARLPSATPQEQKIGHWIEEEIWEDTDGGWGRWQECSVCGQSKHHKTNFCPNCGAKMVEPQESEE